MLKGKSRRLAGQLDDRSVGRRLDGVSRDGRTRREHQTHNETGRIADRPEAQLLCLLAQMTVGRSVGKRESGYGVKK